MKNLIFTKLAILLFISLNAVGQDGKFTFTIANPVTTSAGVFRNDSILVRTLWSDEQYAPGNFTKIWDGKDDYGNSLINPDSLYKIKVLTNNVKYEWQGTIGNTSDSMTGASKHKGYYNCMTGLAFGNTYGYFCNGYSEGLPSIGKFNIATPNQKIYIFTDRQSNANTNYVTTDGVNVYWGALDAANSFVYATRVSDDIEVNFSSGTNYTPTWGRTYAVTSYLNSPNSAISGLAVQKTGRYLFVARAGLGQLQVIDKSTGLLVQTLSYSQVTGLSVDGNDNLWMISGAGKVSKYAVNTNGTLGAAILSLTGLISPLATQVSRDGSLISVADGSTSQQVKFYNNSTGAAINTLGVAGGYFSDATVNNNKFYFNDINGNKFCFIAYQPDGSFWINDPGNFRVQHYNSNRVYVDRIMALGANYGVFADKGNLKKVFSNLLEFEIDYSVQSLTGTSGWILKRNWGANISSTIYDLQYGPSHTTTLSNGRTYALVRKSDNNYEVVEFGPGNQLRMTGEITDNSKKVLCSDGSRQGYTNIGTTATFSRFPLTGFDASGNPKWSSTGEILAVGIINNTIGNPIVSPTSQIFSTTDKVVLYNHRSFAGSSSTYSSGYHLGLMQKGANNNYLFQTEKSTQRSYSGVYPKAGWFDVGNNVNNYSGGNVNIVDKNIITSYHGEFWKNGQTNKYNHYYDNGLALAQFGTTRYDVGNSAIAAPGMAGNALTPVLVKDNVGDLYLWHGDEGDHSGIHRWKITGLNTINVIVIPILFPSSYVTQLPNFIDLMAGLPIDNTLLNNTAGWTRKPEFDIIINPISSYFSVKTGVLQISKQMPNDLYIKYVEDHVDSSIVNKDLGTNNVNSSWKVTGSVAYPGNMPNGSAISQYFEILDDAGKVITSFCPSINRTIMPFEVSITGNNNTIVSGGTIDIANLTKDFLPFSISVVNGNVTFEYGNFLPVTTPISDVTGNWRKPKTLRLKFINNGTNLLALYPAIIDLRDLKLYKDYLPSVPVNTPPVANAGNDTVITLPANAISLLGSGTDPDGFVTIFKWAKISGPAAGVIAATGDSSTQVTNLTNGIYKFELTVKDSYGDIGKDTMMVTVNVSPTANAGADKIIHLPATNVMLAGSGTDPEGKLLTFQWSKFSGPASFNIVNGNTPNPQIDNLTTGVYQFQLMVTDIYGASGWDLVQVLVNVPPVANAGADISFTLPANSTTLSGRGTDSDGQVVVYAWAKVEGPSNYTIVSGQSQNTSVTNLVRGTYKFQLTVTDNSGGKGFDTMQVIVNGSPIASAGINRVISLPVTTFTITGSGIDPDGNTLTYSWVKFSGPTPCIFSSPKSSSTVVDGLSQRGIYKFHLTVTDIYGAIGRDTMELTVNAPPVANAGTSKIISLPINNTTLTGSGSDPDGNLTGYSWKKISGPAAGTIATPNAATTNLNGLTQGIYKFQLTVTDSYGATGLATVQVTVNVPPVANAGVDKILTLPTNSSTLPGSGSDVDGQVVSYGWNKLSGPATGTMKTTSSATAGISHLVQGIYLYQLTVKDNFGAVGKDTVQVTVIAAPIFAPLASAGTNKVITQPTSSITLAGSGTAPGGNIVSYAWTKLSGPASHKFVKANAASTEVNSLAKGVYVFQLTVTDNRGAKATSKVQITVNAAVKKTSTSTATTKTNSAQPTLISIPNVGSSRGNAIISVESTVTKNLFSGSSIVDSTFKLTARKPLNNTIPKFFNSNGVKVFPNPAKDFVNLSISISGKDDKLSISLLNAMGMLVQYKQMSVPAGNTNHKLDLSPLPSGMYFIIVRFNDGQEINYRLVKE